MSTLVVTQRLTGATAEEDTGTVYGHLSICSFIPGHNVIAILNNVILHGEIFLILCRLSPVVDGNSSFREN